MTSRPDPRVVGGRYYNGYWKAAYTVLAIESGVPIWGTQWTVLWDTHDGAGEVTRHSTAWDWRRDKVLGAE